MSPTLLMKNPLQESARPDLRSVLDLRNQQLNAMEQSVGTIEEDRTRIHLHSTEATVTIVSLRRELEEARAGALTMRVFEEAARLQISRMMDEQLDNHIVGICLCADGDSIPQSHHDPLDD